MRTRLTVLLVALALALTAPASSAHEVTGAMIFNTGPFPCDGTPIRATWVNTTAATVYVFKARAWHGRDYGVLADYHTEVRTPGGSYVALFQQDAYDMSPLRWLDTSYEGHYQSLAPGQAFQLLTFCQQLGGPPGGHGHTTVTIWSGGRG